MSHFTFTVETGEMASALHGVAPHVDGATAAVVAMQSAVIVAEQRAADNICENVNRGFFSLIRSQISQKMAAYRSQVVARLLELRDQSAKLTSVKNTMQRDFQMITARYTKLFQSLDAALFSRIHEVDQLIVDLVQKDVKRLCRRSQGLQASLPVNQLESVRSSQLIAASETKANAHSAIAAMNRFIADSNLQNQLTMSILGDKAEGITGPLFLPIALVEFDSLRSRQRQWQLKVPKLPSATLVAEMDKALEQSIFTALPQLEWKQVDTEDRERIARRFNQLVDQAQLSERVRSQVAHMFASSKWSGLVRVKA
jgi:hypothetical protein